MKNTIRFVGYLASMLFGVLFGLFVGAHLFYTTLLIDGVDATRYSSDEIVAMVVDGAKLEAVTYVVVGGEAITTLPGALWNLLVLGLSVFLFLMMYHLTFNRMVVNWLEKNDSNTWICKDCGINNTSEDSECRYCSTHKGLNLNFPKRE